MFKILLLYLSHLNFLKREFFSKKRTLMDTNLKSVVTEGPHVTDKQDWMVIKPHFNN